jgi:hypothetical protein
MMTKREVLISICENPGWSPAWPDPGSRVQEILTQLNEEGWILPRLDGYEATPKALTEYPHFASEEDLRDPEAHASEPSGPPEPVVSTEWVKVVLDRTLVLHPEQTVSMPIREHDLDGGITLTKLGNDWTTRVEIQIALRIRELPINDKEGE